MQLSRRSYVQREAKDALYQFYCDYMKSGAKEDFRKLTVWITLVDTKEEFFVYPSKVIYDDNSLNVLWEFCSAGIVRVPKRFCVREQSFWINDFYLPEALEEKRPM